MRFGGTKPSKTTVGTLRRGQIITGAGCGAIVDTAKESVIIAGTDYWTNFDDECFILYEDNLQKFLGVDFFVAPSANNKDSFKKTQDIPAFRFPNWMFCPSCKRLAHERVFGFNNKPMCMKCKRELVPSRFVIACKNGHLDDFPYEWWVHKGQCQESNKPELYIEMSEKSSGLESVIIKCKSCGKTRSMAGSFGGDSLKGFKCTHRRPWLNDREKAHCDQQMRTVQRGASNLYFAVNTAALSIPPWSAQVQIMLAKKWSTLSCLLRDKITFITVVETLGIPRECNCSAEEVYEQAMFKYNHEECNDEKTWQDILEGEYKAFLRGGSDEDGEFKIRTEKVPDILTPYIESIVLATRLREVMALRGFKRLDPDFDVNNEESFCKVSRDFKNWLPAVELKGEGIFIKFNEQLLRKWEIEAQERYRTIVSNMELSFMKKTNFSPRYVLLHTLSHLLIRQLILQCGYSTASIKERIYSTFVDEEMHIEMAGILIYTSSNDSEGSLGGLVREGVTERFENSFRQMLETASWCSTDPLCIQSKGQGVDSLNFAACHSCTLLPETSCEARNCYLDRAALIGTLDEPKLGYFYDLLAVEKSNE